LSNEVPPGIPPGSGKRTSNPKITLDQASIKALSKEISAQIATMQKVSEDLSSGMLKELKSITEYQSKFFKSQLDRLKKQDKDEAIVNGDKSKADKFKRETRDLYEKYLKNINDANQKLLAEAKNNNVVISEFLKLERSKNKDDGFKEDIQKLRKEFVKQDYALANTDVLGRFAESFMANNPVLSFLGGAMGISRDSKGSKTDMLKRDKRLRERSQESELGALSNKILRKADKGNSDNYQEPISEEDFARRDKRGFRYWGEKAYGAGGKGSTDETFAGSDTLKFKPADSDDPTIGQVYSRPEKNGPVGMYRELYRIRKILEEMQRGGGLNANNDNNKKPLGFLDEIVKTAIGNLSAEALKGLGKKFLPFILESLIPVIMTDVVGAVLAGVAGVAFVGLLAVLVGKVFSNIDREKGLKDKTIESMKKSGKYDELKQAGVNVDNIPEQALAHYGYVPDNSFPLSPDEVALIADYKRNGYMALNPLSDERRFQDLEDKKQQNQSAKNIKDFENLKIEIFKDLESSKQIPISFNEKLSTYSINNKNLASSSLNNPEERGKFETLLLDRATKSNLKEFSVGKGKFLTIDALKTALNKNQKLSFDKGAMFPSGGIMMPKPSSPGIDISANGNPATMSENGQPEAIIPLDKLYEKFDELVIHMKQLIKVNQDGNTIMEKSGASTSRPSGFALGVR